ncbi:Uncharacterized conserved protein YbbC, DUF1343 family [Flaviramulus basaltis]|uniref:Uncharacterized conserved protein YbbC, DUF1343 family n=1 Tax=Flaviramulus basaltis TaxID=369401 RepID=A0A1K2IK51_9FLAO|nr:DUF1343 domain-containing protein [Flaviramulus basaltis]SFZ92686.1 Uncharacterized conserved protein YbbC, DUF1343 family [Flaviramulus basaltis]
MRFNVFKNTVLLFVLVMISCANLSKSEAKTKNTEVTKKDEILKQVQDDSSIVVGANQIEKYLPLLKDKRVGVVANQSSLIEKQIASSLEASRNNKYTHLVDSLLSLKVNISIVLSPEHGFRGTADAGEKVKDGIDSKTGLPIVSLYGDNKKPKLEQIKETKKYESDINKGIMQIDVMVFDLQDVGARFYTYISTLHYVMEACAEANIPLIILDRPNPNGHYIDGPILEMEHTSFVGMHPIPVVHGMTIGEYAKMINGEKWLKNNVQCALTVIPVKHYTHNTNYNLPIKPSPNLPNDKAINLYPSLCFFEGTNVSIGRGTNKQFQVVGSPYYYLKRHTYEFTPEPNEGAKHPKHQDKACHGYDLSNEKSLNSLNLKWLIEFYKANKQYAPNEKFFNAFFTKLAGTKKLQQQIEAGLNEYEIKATWKEGLETFKQTREKYLIYE